MPSHRTHSRRDVVRPGRDERIGWQRLVQGAPRFLSGNLEKAGAVVSIDRYRKRPHIDRIRWLTASESEDDDRLVPGYSRAGSRLDERYCWRLIRRRWG